MKKEFNFKNIKGMLSRDEMKQIKGGSGGRCAQLAQIVTTEFVLVMFNVRVSLHFVTCLVLGLKHMVAGNFSYAETIFLVSALFLI